MKNNFSDELISRIEKEIRNKVLEREKKYKEHIKLTQSKEVTIDSLIAVSELTNDEIDEISDDVFKKYGFPDIKELQKINHEINQLKHYKDLIELFKLKIPGFSNHTYKADIQNADRITRNFIFGKLVEYKEEIINLMKKEQKKNNIELLPELDSIIFKIETIAKMCNYADYISGKNQKNETGHYTLLDYNWKLVKLTDEIGFYLNNPELNLKWMNGILNKIESFEELLENRKSIISEKYYDF